MLTRATLIVVGATLALALVIFAVALQLAARSPVAPRGEDAVPGSSAPTWAPPAAPPAAAADPGWRIATKVDADWVVEVAAATGIPERALAAYAGAALEKARTMPECALSWATIAGIGATESNHGRHDGSVVGADGTVSPPIYGVALDGDGNVLIEDSDGGDLDGDATFDRAVGPFQLIPQTWRNWHVDGNRDGVEDPQNIDDAALATVNYLCRAVAGVGESFATEDGWRAGVAAFNSPDSYLAKVAAAAVQYAAAADAVTE